MSKRPPGEVYAGKRLPTHPFPPQLAPRAPSPTPDPPVEADYDSPTTATFAAETDEDPFTLDDPFSLPLELTPTATFGTETEDEFPIPPDAFFPLPLPPPTTLDLLIEMEFALDVRPQPQHQPYRWYTMYHLYWELYQLRFIARDFFDRGITLTYPLLDKLELLDLQARINEGEVTGMDGVGEPWSMEDHWRLMAGVKIVFKGAGDGDVNTCLHVTAHVVGRMSTERTRRGVLAELYPPQDQDRIVEAVTVVVGNLNETEFDRYLKVHEAAVVRVRSDSAKVDMALTAKGIGVGEEQWVLEIDGGQSIVISYA